MNKGQESEPFYCSGCGGILQCIKVPVIGGRLRFHGPNFNPETQGHLQRSTTVYRKRRIGDCIVRRAVADGDNPKSAVEMFLDEPDRH